MQNEMKKKKTSRHWWRIGIKQMDGSILWWRIVKKRFEPRIANLKNITIVLIEDLNSSMREHCLNNIKVIPFGSKLTNKHREPWILKENLLNGEKTCPQKLLIMKSLGFLLVEFGIVVGITSQLFQFIQFQFL